MHCKKCLHYELCVKIGKPSLYGINQEIGCSSYKDKTKWAEKKDAVTNADRIRAMSDEELAAFMFSMVDCVSCQNKLMNNGKLVFGADRKTCTDKDYYAMCDGDGRKCESVCLEWLKNPAE